MKGDQAIRYFEKNRPAIRRQLGPIFAAAGGWNLIRAILDYGTPIGKFSEEEAKAQLAGSA